MDNFSNLPELGSGAFSVVYKLNDYQVLKLSNDLCNEDEKKQIVREYEILKYLTSDNRCPDSLVKVYDIYMENDRCGIIEELIHGWTLYEFIELNPKPRQYSPEDVILSLIEGL